MSLNDVLPQCPSLFDEVSEEVERLNICSEKILIEDTINSLLSSVEANSVDIHQHDDNITQLDEPTDNDTWGLSPREAPICTICNFDIFTISGRCNILYEFPPDYMVRDQRGLLGDEPMCKSCSYDGIKCNDCGVSEKLVKIECDRNAKFHMVSHEGLPNIYRCDTCFDIYNEGEGTIVYEETENEPCPYCNERHQPWECPSNLWDTYHNEYVIDTDGDSTLIENIPNEEPDEFEEDSHDPSNNVKINLKEIMEILYEFNDIIPEGKYIDIMDKLKETYDYIIN